MGGWLQDVRFAIRSLFKRPGFTAVAALTLALGIGANTTIFSLVYGILLQPLPYPEPDRVVEIWNHWEGSDQSGLADPEFLTYHGESRSFDAMAALQQVSVNLTGDGEPERLAGVAASSEVFAVLGTEPVLGRVFTFDEDQPGGDAVAVISHELWQRRFASDPELVGSSIPLNGVPSTVLGVLPPGTRLPRDLRRDTRTDVWFPLRLDTAQPGPWGMHSLEAIGRLAPGVKLGEAQAEMDLVVERMKETAMAKERDAVTSESFGVRLWPAHDQVVGPVEAALLVLLTAVAFVLAIACVNVANLFLVRAESRRHELALRTAIGASRAQLVRQLLTESLLLATLGGAAGLLFATWGLELLLGLLPSFVPRISEVSLDVHVLLFALGVTFATGLVFGLLPAFQVSKGGLIAWLHGGTRAGEGNRQRLRSTLVVAEMALAAVLVIVAGLLVKSFWKIRQVDPGYRTEQVLSMYLELPRSAYPEASDVVGFFRDARQRLSTVPGVEQVGAGTHVPLAMGRGDWNFYPEGRVLEANEPSPRGDWQVVSAGYFETLGISLYQGRTFTDADETGAPLVLVVNRSLAERYWPDASPVGERVRLGGNDDNPHVTIIGVVADIRYDGLHRDPVPEIYIPHSQAHLIMGISPRLSMALMMRTAVPPREVIGAVRAEVAALDADLPVSTVATMEEIRSGSMAISRLSTVLLTAFATLALVLGAIGIFGVVSYSVVRRTREIGVRMALGARRRSVLGLVVGHGMRLAAAGLGVGLVLAFGVTRLLGSLLYDVAPADPSTFAVVTLILAGVAFLASYLPGRRAASIDPIHALREE